MLKSFEENKDEDSILRLKRISIRFDRRCYNFSKTTNALTPYWLTLSLSRRGRISLPIVFGKRQKRRIEEALRGEWAFATVEMVKRNGEWYAHFVLKKSIGFEEPETVIAIDRGERNLAVAVAISKESPNKPMRGQFWKGGEIKRIRGLCGHIRRKLQEKRRIGKVKELKGRERRKVNQQLHIVANQIAAYAKQFFKPMIVMEDLTGVREGFKKSKGLNKRFHSLAFRRLQTYVEYKANLHGIEVRYLTKEETKNTTKTCHKCGHVVRRVLNGKLKCPKCRLNYDRDLNAAINIARRVMSSMGWRSREPLEPAYVTEGVKPQANVGSSRLSRGEAHLTLSEIKRG